MIRIDEIQQAWGSLCGWRQRPVNHLSDRIDPSLTVSESGLFFQDAHPLLTLENIEAAMPEGFVAPYLHFSSDTDYKKGDKITNEEGVCFIALEDILSGSEFDESQWDKWTNLSEFVQTAVKSAISDVIMNFLEAKKLNQETKTLLERRTLFNGAASVRATIPNKGKVVGFEITPVRAMGVTTKIERIGIQLINPAGGPGWVRLALFHSSRPDIPVWEQTVEIIGARGKFYWIVPNSPLYLPYHGYMDLGDQDKSLGDGGSWYLCYNQDELSEGVEALNTTKDWSKQPCSTCGVDNIEVWGEITRYIQVSPFYTKDANWLPGARQLSIGDPSRFIYTNTINYGLNCEISVGCDLTDFLIEQKSVFARLLQKQVAANLLRAIAMNPDVRVNRNQANVGRMDILYELDGNPQGRSSGLNHELQQAYKAVDLDTKGLSRACWACNNKGVKFRIA